VKQTLLGLLLIAVAASTTLEGHAFLKRAEPAVGSTIQSPPGQVRIWFSEKIEPTLSSVQVFDGSGREVDNHDGRLDRSRQESLRVSLPPLQAGTYKVVWRVVSVDSHVTKGSFMFRVAR
jgi:methionine-rich copper-binding protein CopC